MQSYVKQLLCPSFLIADRGERTFVQNLHFLTGSFQSSPFQHSALTKTKRIGLAVFKSEQLKRNLEQVNEFWKNASAPFVYEFLYLDEGARWDNVSTLYKRSRSSAEFPYGLGAGGYMRRLDLSTSMWTEEEASGASRLLLCCPKLAVLTLGMDVEFASPMPHQVVKILLAINTSFLHTLAFRSFLEPHSMHAFMHKAHSFKFLHTLSLRFRRFVVPPGADYALVIMAVLHTLELITDDPSSVLRVMSRWELPSLRRVALSGQTRVEKDGTIAFFEEHGAQLNTFEFEDLSVVSKQVISLCPNLTDIITDVRYAVFNDLAGHPCVERYGLRGFGRVAHSLTLRFQIMDCFERLFPQFVDESAYPHLSLVRLLDYDQSDFVQQGWWIGDAKRWSHWVREFEKIPATFEDHAGQAMKVQTAEESFFIKHFDLR